MPARNNPPFKIRLPKPGEPCKRCKGTGFDGPEGDVCVWCRGSGKYFPYEGSETRNNPPLSTEGKRVIAEYTAGTSVEMREHGGPWHKAAKIAVDHLNEDDHYYTKLKSVFPEESEYAASEVAKVGLRFNPGEDELDFPAEPAGYEHLSVATREQLRRHYVHPAMFGLNEYRMLAWSVGDRGKICENCEGELHTILSVNASEITTQGRETAQDIWPAMQDFDFYALAEAPIPEAPDEYGFQDAYINLAQQELANPANFTFSQGAPVNVLPRYVINTDGRRIRLADLPVLAEVNRPHKHTFNADEVFGEDVLLACFHDVPTYTSVTGYMGFDKTEIEAARNNLFELTVDHVAYVLDCLRLPTDRANYIIDAVNYVRKEIPRIRELELQKAQLVASGAAESSRDAKRTIAGIGVALYNLSGTGTEACARLRRVTLESFAHPMYYMWASAEQELDICNKIHRVFANAEGKRPTKVPLPELGNVNVVWRHEDPSGSFYVAEMQPDQLIEVGRYMKHCVGGPPYPQRAREGTHKYYVLFTAEGRPKFCLEVAQYKGKAYNIPQVKGMANRVPQKPTELGLLAQFITWLGIDPYDQKRVADMAALHVPPRENPWYGREHEEDEDYDGYP